MSISNLKLNLDLVQSVNPFFTVTSQNTDDLETWIA